MLLHELEKVKDMLHKLSYILNRQQKRYGALIFFMSIVSALLETMGVSLVLPLIQAILDIGSFVQKPYILPFIRIFHLERNEKVIVFVCLVVIVVYLAKNAFSAVYIWASSKYTNKINRELSVRILGTYMDQEYGFFVENNSGRLLRGMGADVSNVYSILSQLFSLLTKAFSILCIAVFIVIQAPGLAVLLLCLISFCFFLSQLLFRKPMRKYGMIARESSAKANQASLEAIQGSKEVLVTNRQSYFVKRYEECVITANRANVHLSIASAIPANIIETVCVTGLLLAVAFETITAEDPNVLIAQLATIAIAAFRIMPYLGSVLSSINAIMYNAPGLVASYDTLQMINRVENKWEDSGKRKGEKNSFLNEIELSHISFAYPGKEDVIHDLNLTIKKGTSIGFIGTSGAGKTTLADIILGLYKPQDGKIVMDGIDIEDIGSMWHRLVGYVPQSVYLTDASIRRNVAFGIEEALIDDEKVWKVLEMAQMKQFVQSLPKGLDTRVGEWGVQFSGGQRQRIAIARALYGDPDVIILDEATAALDTETETAVMESIEALQKVKTLIIVAHRLTTVKNCDKIYEITGGQAVERSKKDIFGE